MRSGRSTSSSAGNADGGPPGWLSRTTYCPALIKRTGRSRRPNSCFAPVDLGENLVREDLKPIEQAKAFRAAMDLNDWSTHDVARELAVDQSSVVRALKLLDLPVVVQEQVEQGTLSPATAYEVSKLDDPDEQAALADRVVSEGLSRAETVEAMRRASGRSARGKGRGGCKPTTRVFRRVAGCTITVENGRGLQDPEMVRAALAE